MNEPPESAAADPLEGAWEKVDRAWEDPETHRRFLALAATLGRLSEAGRRYREVRDRSPDRRAAAEKQIERLLALAMQDLALTRSPAPADGKRVTTWLGVAVTLMLVCATTWALLRLR